MSEAEKSALAILLDEPSMVCDSGLTPNHFLTKNHRFIFEEIMDQSSEQNADMTTVASALSGRVDGAYVAELYGDYFWHNHKSLDTHIKTIINAYNAQKVRYIGQKMMNGEGDPLTILAEAESELAECTNAATLFRTNKAILKGTMDTLEMRVNSPDGVVGERLHFKKIDSILGGGYNGRLWLLGGRPGQGKSALAGNIVERKAIVHHEPCCVLSFEMGDETWMERFLMSIADVRASEKENSYGFRKEDYTSMMQATEKIVNAPVYILEYAGKTIDDVCMTIKLMNKKHNVKFFVIDYIQLIGGRGSEYERVTDASIRLTALKQKLKINILALSQLNRESESGGKARKPGPSDLRNSGQLEQDADGIMFVHRPLHYDKTLTGDAAYDVISIPKNRHGKTGDVKAKFTGHTFKWKEVT